MERLLVLLLLSGAAAFLLTRYALRFPAGKIGFALVKGAAILSVLAYAAAFLVFYKPEAWGTMLVEMARSLQELPGTPTALGLAAMAGAIGARRTQRREPGQPLAHTARKWFLGSAALVVGTIVLAGCAQPRASAPAAAALDLLRQPERLRDLVTANQIVFAGGAGNLEPICRCGPKVYLSQVAKPMRDAVVAVEDKRFFRHRGIDPNGLIRAGLRMVLTAGKRVEGASTIPQQLIKNTVLTSDREGSRKWTEWRLALALQDAMSPDDVLAAYLNQVIFAYDRGRPVVGVENAARFFFGRRASDLNLREAATLAGLLKAPAAFNPLTHPDRAKKRAETVLGLMAEQGMITRRDAQATLKNRRAKGSLKPVFPETRSFVQWVLADVQAGMPGFRFSRTTRIPLTLEVVTQANAENALESTMGRINALAQAEAGFVTVGFDGRVVAMVGQRDFARSQLNFVTQTKRQPASTMKALVFASAFENKALKPSPFLTGKFAVSDRETAVSAAQKVGGEKIVATARRLGILAPLTDVAASLALGASEVSLLELTSAYMPFGTKGIAAKPFGYLGLVQDWRLVAWHRPEKARVRSVRTADAVHAMLRAVVTQGTGWPAQGIKLAAGKTGTNGEAGEPFNRDAWFIGMTDRHLSGLWIGRSDNQPMSGVRGSTAAGVWAAVEKALPGTL